MKDWQDHRSSRRQVLITLSWLSLLPLTGLWYSMVSRKLYREKASIIRIKLEDIPEGTSVHNECLVNRQNNLFVVFSIKCTHLGCRLKMTNNHLMTCPCHGSSFNPENGMPVKGPGKKRLEQLDFVEYIDYLEIKT